MEEGIPGHASHERWANELQRRLRELGVSFEAEGEATRINLGEGIVVEIAEAPEGEEGYAVVANIPLPTGGDPEYADSVALALKVLAALGSELKYELDESLPGYPMLRVRAVFKDPLDMSRRLLEVLESVAKR
ncbi:MAG: hypothetical protein LRS46_01200 [Desulfurococcales archaeon]|nr:hypothetical protein [Desulfurococcales archaeon]